jgi:2-desacetyl-2-hydroxyethyl bacteriochlorophyllide A dehydrogenase
MKAAIMRDGKIVVDEIPELTPSSGQVLVETIACGICGSDLHAIKQPKAAVEAITLDGMPPPYDPEKDVVMGHEFSARIVDLGEGVANVATGDAVVTMPMLMTPAGPALLGYSNDYPGGYSERMLLTAAMCLKVPDSLDPRFAALTEPMAVGLHAVNKVTMSPSEAAIVLGCGPIGLAIIAALRINGVQSIIAADFSPARRKLAEHMGATTIVDPREEQPMDAWRRTGGAAPVIFEAVGLPGVLDQAIRSAPRQGRIVVAGVCMENDTIWPIVAIGKELTISFSLGYTPQEFAQTLDLIASGEIDVAPLITGEVGLEGVAQAFEDLGNPEKHAKILVEPSI